jgi:NAD+-dependent secondary alcohol dehydrogenase Adh1
MKAVRVHAYGKRPSVDDVPEPTVSGPLDVLVEIGAAGLCRTDLHIVEGQLAEKSGVSLPYIIGHENAGWVREVGDAVTNVAPGDAVILHPLVTCGLCRPCRSGDDVHCENSSFPGIDTVTVAAVTGGAPVLSRICWARSESSVASISLPNAVACGA